MKAGKFLYCWSKQTEPSEEVWTLKEDCTRTVDGRITFHARTPLSREEVKSILGELFDRCNEICAISFDRYQHPEETHYYDIVTNYEGPTTYDDDTRAQYYAVRSSTKPIVGQPAPSKALAFLSRSPIFEQCCFIPEEERKLAKGAQFFTVSDVER